MEKKILRDYGLEVTQDLVTGSYLEKRYTPTHEVETMTLEPRGNGLILLSTVTKGDRFDSEVVHEYLLEPAHAMKVVSRWTTIRTGGEVE